MGSAYVARQPFLHNRFGGLQVLPPGADDWKYVKVGQWFHSIQLPAAWSSWSLVLLFQPVPGHAICNLGDAMATFSAGVLRSNLHRVVKVFIFQ